MNARDDKRPLSPYMLGPYYRFQITSLLSIANRLTGLFLGVVTAPLAIAWLLALAAGPDVFANAQALAGSLVGQLVALLSLLSLWFHFFNGIRHLIWDTGAGFEMHQVRAGGWAVVIATVLATALSWWVAT